MSGFAHLHNHTHYSLLDGAARVSDLVARAAESGQKALAITDHGNMFGVIEFYKECGKKGIKPIIGYESYVAPKSYRDREKDASGASSYHLTLLARNNDGYKNLLLLATEAYTGGFYNKPRVDKELLAKHGEGLIALSGCIGGEIPHLLMVEAFDAAREVAQQYLQIFGKDNFFIEIQDHGLAEQKKILPGLVALARELDIPLVATNDCHYVRKEDAKIQEVLLCIQTGKTLTDTDRMRFGSDDFYLKTESEMKAVFSEYPDAIANTVDIAQRCNVELRLASTSKFGKSDYHMPQFPTPDDKNPADYLWDLGQQGLKRIYGEPIPPEVEARFSHEFNMIKKMGFESYFLIVADFIWEARRRGIPVGPGRGSGAGSLLAYALDITRVDPLKYNLLFERFLNTERISMPDMDIDFCKDRRSEVIEYVQGKYGWENVAQIVTFMTLQARAAIRDSARVLGLPLKKADFIAKSFPENYDSIKQAIEKDKEFRNIYETDNEAREILDISMGLEGIVRGVGKHAAGVVIADRRLTDYAPLFKAGDDLMVQFEMSNIEEIGLLKMDFLGLKTLTVLDRCLKMIKERHGKDVDLMKLPIDDRATYELISAARTKGVFQLESSGFRDIQQKAKPDVFEDLIALIALYRPGPLKHVDSFVRRKHGSEKIDYYHESIKPILQDTYGIILYQEQVMQIATKMANFPPNEADTLRKAMGKKNIQKMEEYEKKFIDGAVKNGVPAKLATEIYGVMKVFGEYGFNKSHSTAYALVAYWTAYLKAHYTQEYMASLMTYEMGDTNKLVSYIEDCREMDIKVFPPDINTSRAGFTISDKGLHFGLAAVKGVGEKAVDAIVAERTANGNFKSLFEFCERVDPRAVNKSVVESLIKCGAFQCTGAKRSQLLAVLEKALDLGSNAHKDKISGQGSMFGDVEESSGQDVNIDLPAIPELPENQLLAFEKELLGRYVTSHPLVKYERILKAFATSTIDKVESLEDGQEVVLGGVIVSVNQRSLKNKQGEFVRMAKPILEDLTGQISTVVFPDLFEQSINTLKDEAKVFMKGRLELRGESSGLRVSEIIPMEAAYEKLTRGVRIKLNSLGLEQAALTKLKDIIQAHPGKIPIFFDLTTGERQRVLISSNYQFKVAPSLKFFEEAEKAVGEGHVFFTGGNGQKQPAAQPHRTYGEG